MKNSAIRSSLFISAIAMSSFSCTSTPPNPAVQRAQVYFVIDGGEQSLTDAKEKEQRLQISTYMNENLMGTLKRRGMHAVPLKKQEDFSAGPDKYLLTTKITRYNAGSKAARMIVGMGAGSASMDVHFEFKKDKVKTLEVGDPSVASSRDWMHIVHKIDETIADSIVRTLTSSAAK